MSENSITESVTQQIKAVVFNTHYWPATRLLFLETIAKLIEDLIPIAETAVHNVNSLMQDGGQVNGRVE